VSTGTCQVEPRSFPKPGKHLGSLSLDRTRPTKPPRLPAPARLGPTSGTRATSWSSRARECARARFVRHFAYAHHSCAPPYSPMSPYGFAVAAPQVGRADAPVRQSAPYGFTRGSAGVLTVRQVHGGAVPLVAASSTSGANTDTRTGAVSTVPGRAVSSRSIWRGGVLLTCGAPLCGGVFIVHVSHLKWRFSGSGPWMSRSLEALGRRERPAPGLSADALEPGVVRACPPVCRVVAGPAGRRQDPVTADLAPARTASTAGSRSPVLTMPG
jgi:hypothetical protein